MWSNCLHTAKFITVAVISYETRKICLPVPQTSWKIQDIALSENTKKATKFGIKVFVGKNDFRAFQILFYELFQLRIAQCLHLNFSMFNAFCRLVLTTKRLSHQYRGIVSKKTERRTLQINKATITSIQSCHIESTCEALFVVNKVLCSVVLILTSWACLPRFLSAVWQQYCIVCIECLYWIVCIEWFVIGSVAVRVFLSAVLRQYCLKRFVIPAVLWQ